MTREIAEEIMARCDELALFTEEPGRVTRTFLSPPMHQVHERVGEWMREAGLTVSVDAAGNIRGVRGHAADRLIVGSHLDTVPDAGKYDGILGVIMGIALARTTSVPLAVVGFSEEEGVRFGVPFIGSRALIGTAAPVLEADARIGQAILDFGLDPSCLDDARLEGAAYFEIHVEQGPVLESLNEPIAAVDAIAGQSRWTVTFTGAANHAGTTPMHLRRDALACAAEWITAVRACGLNTEGLVATVGRCEVEPGAGNVVPGRVQVSLDARHKQDSIRLAAIDRLLEEAQEIAQRHQAKVDAVELLNAPATAMHPKLVTALKTAVTLTSGAGHDAMILAQVMPAVMLFIRSPGGVSHHPDETVLVEDIETAYRAGKQFVENWRG